MTRSYTWVFTLDAQPQLRLLVLNYTLCTRVAARDVKQGLYRSIASLAGETNVLAEVISQNKASMSTGHAWHRFSTLDSSSVFFRVYCVPF